MMSLQANDFELFEVPMRFAQDRALLDARWRALQQQAHPDRFAAQGAGAQRVALQWSVRINEAHQRLKDPLQRAAYLCELQGAPVRAEHNTAMPAAFLVQQMDLRERLEDAHTAPQLEALLDEVMQHQSALHTALAHALDEAKDPQLAAQQVRALMFVARFVQDLTLRLDQLDQIDPPAPPAPLV